MIDTQEKALLVQGRRFEAGKVGTCRAVRRYFRRKTRDWYGYNELKQGIAHLINQPMEKHNGESN